MKSKSKHVMTVSKLFGRCLTIQVGPANFEVKVMGDRATAAAQREVLLTVLASTGVVAVVEGPTTEKGDDS